MEEIRNSVVEILKKYTFDPNVWDNFSGGKKIIQELKINSARIVDIILDIEEKYAIAIEDEVLEQIGTIDDIVRIIQEKTKA